MEYFWFDYIMYINVLISNGSYLVEYCKHGSSDCTLTKYVSSQM